MANTTDTSLLPAGIPPPGVTPALNQPSDLWPSIIAISTITLVLATFSVASRLYAKIRCKTVRWEEYLSAFACAVFIAWTVLFDVNCVLGVSKHQWNVPLSHMPKILSILNIADLLLGPMLGAAKISLLLQLRWHFASHGALTRAVRLAIFATGVVVAGYYFAAVFVVAFQCVPRRGIWDPTAHAVCVSTPIAVFTEGGFALLTDVMICGVFGWVVWVVGARGLGGKTVVGWIGGVAALGIACSAASLYYRLPFIRLTTDITYRLGKLQLWAMVEYMAVIVVGCIPSIGILLTDGTRERWSAESGEKTPGDVEVEAGK